MPEFVVMILADEAEEAELPPSEIKALVEGCSAYERTLRAAAVYLDGERLRPSTEGKRVSFRDGKPRVEDGPFADTPAALAGYYLLEAESLDAALRLAEGCPLAAGASLDVRPVMKGEIKAEKASEQGRVFAFAVLGSAASEQGWVEVMDRIDAGTRGHFEGWLGGMRLHSPGRGRRVTSVGGKRAIFDGPFLESKEVIGGLFFLRRSTLDEAVDWAQKSPFVQHGTLEIRELWRS